jgi:signal transduction histidine kinase
VHSSQHLQALIESLLDISRLEAGHPLGQMETVDLATLVDHVYQVLRTNFEQRQVILEVSFDPLLPAVKAQPNMLLRVFLNLLDNALKHSVEGNTITVSAQPAGEDGFLVVTVDDQGRGVPEEYRKLVFEKFERIRVDRDEKGLGLGLAFCRLAVEAHGGRIWVEDAPDGGARFGFTIAAGSQDCGAPVTAAAS